QLGQQALDDDDLLEARFAGEPREVDLRHAARREQTEQLVAAEPLGTLPFGLVRQALVLCRETRVAGSAISRWPSRPARLPAASSTRATRVARRLATTAAAPPARS